MLTEGDSRYLDVHVYADYLFLGLFISKWRNEMEKNDSYVILSDILVNVTSE